MNFVANDLGVDTIELGGKNCQHMEPALGEIGDVAFMADVLAEIRKGTDKGRRWAAGAARGGEP